LTSKSQNIKSFLSLLTKKIIKPTTAVNDLRIIKGAEEIQAIKNACLLGDEVYSNILKNLKTGKTENEIAFEIELLIRKNEAKISFPAIVAFGSNGSFPHHVPTDKKLQKNTFVLMDFGVKLNNYCSDMTRTIFFGTATKEQRQAYNTVLESQQKAVEHIEKKLAKKEKIKATDVDKIARKHIISQGFPTIPHSLGHGIGLEVHELPHIPGTKEQLEEGMVFSIEPGVYLSDKFGVRIEDLYAIENNELIPLTISTKKLLEI